MKIFLDTANIDHVKKWMEKGIIDGVTTNPTHLSKTGQDPKKQIQELCALFPDGDISVEVTQLEPQNAYKQAKEIASLAKNITVKIPCHIKYYEIIKKLVDDEININVTLVFTTIQSLMMCKLGVKYISPFVGRWDDIDADGIQQLYEIREMVDYYEFDTQILAASLRSVRHFHDAIAAGADVATLPEDVLEKSLTHILTNQGIEKFDEDWQKLGIRQFP